MALLTSIAGRLDDNQIAPNKPVSTSTLQRMGSSINFLLDFLGAADGSTSVAGDLNDLLNAVSVVSSHSLAFQVFIPAVNGSNTVIGTYPSIKFLNRVFYMQATKPWGQGFRGVLTKNVDSNGFVNINASPVTPPSIGGFGAPSAGPVVGTNGQLNPVFDGDDVNSTQFQQYFDAALGTIGYEPRMRDTEWFKLCELDWHEGNSTTLRLYREGGNAGNEGNIYMGYELNLSSAPLTF